MEGMALARSIHGMVEASMVMCEYGEIEWHALWEVSGMLRRPEEGLERCICI
jgi:hypothetical protein